MQGFICCSCNDCWASSTQLITDIITPTVMLPQCHTREIYSAQTAQSSAHSVSQNLPDWWPNSLVVSDYLAINHLYSADTRALLSPSHKPNSLLITLYDHCITANILPVSVCNECHQVHFKLHSLGYCSHQSRNGHHKRDFHYLGQACKSETRVVLNGHSIQTYGVGLKAAESLLSGWCTSHPCRSCHIPPLANAWPGISVTAGEPKELSRYKKDCCPH